MTAKEIEEKSSNIHDSYSNTQDIDKAIQTNNIALKLLEQSGDEQVPPEFESNYAEALFGLCDIYKLIYESIKESKNNEVKISSADEDIGKNLDCYKLLQNHINGKIDNLETKINQDYPNMRNVNRVEENTRADFIVSERDMQNNCCIIL